AMIGSLADWRPSREDIEAARTSLIASEALVREKYHFYIMMSGMRFGLFGREYIEASTAGVKKAGGRDVEALLSSCFDPLQFNAVLIVPPAEAPVEAEEAGRSTRVLGNGCSLAAVTRTGSDIGAVHVMVRGRSCAEAGAIPGMTVLLNKVLEESGPGGALTEELRAIGATVQSGDNPYIPMDDYYLDRSFSFIRIEGPATGIIEATRLVVEHLTSCAVTDEDVEALPALLAGELGVRSASGQAGLRNGLLRRLFPGHPYSAPIFPAMMSLGRVTAEELTAFRDRTICGANLIVTLVSPVKGSEGLDSLEEIFSALPAGERVTCPDLPGAAEADSPGASEPGDTDLESPGQGAYIGAAWTITGPSPAEGAAASIAAEVLSMRMQLQIRETEGLAYSTGCSASLMPGVAVISASVSTRAENLEIATEALRNEISRLAAEPPSAGEIETARRRVLGRFSRRELSSINEAFAVGLDLLIRDGAGLGRLIAGLPASGVLDILSRVMTPDASVLLRMVPGSESAPKGPPGGMEKKSPPPGMMGR
ncbi:MAG TPA: insulinase family protein, partial [Candidatus Krumholzibacterium sp.]|nr:insulinase family protein [Candidatus Krumholzibacterium sp.]